MQRATEIYFHPNFSIIFPVQAFLFLHTVCSVSNSQYFIFLLLFYPLSLVNLATFLLLILSIILFFHKGSSARKIPSPRRRRSALLFPEKNLMMIIFSNLIISTLYAEFRHGERRQKLCLVRYTNSRRGSLVTSPFLQIFSRLFLFQSGKPIVF